VKSNEIKKLVGTYAVDNYMRSGMNIGMGTGTTAVEAVKRLGELYRSGKIANIRVITTSLDTENLCYAESLPVSSLDHPAVGGVLDVAVDGADEVDKNLNCTKGGGGALLREKIVAYASKFFAVIVDAGKCVEELGKTFSIPVEVVPFARVTVEKQLTEMGGKVTLRAASKKIGPVITDNGNIILDTSFPAIQNPEILEKEINAIPGVVENGIFSCSHVQLVICGMEDGSVKEIKK